VEAVESGGRKTRTRRPRRKLLVDPGELRVEVASVSDEDGGARAAAAEAYEALADLFFDWLRQKHGEVRTSAVGAASERSTEAQESIHKKE
jgi:hypothetical protein